MNAILKYEVGLQDKKEEGEINNKQEYKNDNKFVKFCWDTWWARRSSWITLREWEAILSTIESTLEKSW